MATGKSEKRADTIGIGNMRSSADRMTKTNRSAAAGYRPGHPISPEAWSTFMQCRGWMDVPKIFMPLYADGSKRGGVEEPEKSEKSVQESTVQDPVFFGLNLTCVEKGFADEVDKNEMLRILCGETVRWGLPVIDFVLLDDALHLIICLESTREAQVHGQEHESEEKGLRKKEQDALQEWSRERWQTYMLNQFALSLERRYQEYYAQRMELPCTFLPHNLLCRYSGPLQTLNACCRMHTLPVSLGFVNDIKLYWFSGYNTVRGKFAWNFMDPTRLLKALSDRPNKAVRQYMAAHRAFLAEADRESRNVP